MAVPISTRLILRKRGPRLTPVPRYSYLRTESERRFARPAGGAGASRVIDTQLSYLIMNWYARVLLNYRHSSIDLGGAAALDDRLVLGVVLWDP